MIVFIYYNPSALAAWQYDGSLNLVQSTIRYSLDHRCHSLGTLQQFTTVQ